MTCLSATHKAEHFTTSLGKIVKDGKTTIYLEKETSGMLKACEPHIYKVKDDKLIIYYLDEIKHDNITTYGNKNGLFGNVYDNKNVKEGMYVVYGKKAVRCGTGCKINGGYAYIDMEQVPTITLEKAQGAIPLSAEYDATDITEQINENGKTIPHYYNLQGQCVTSPQKGLYIVNGKKVIIK